MSNIGLNKDNLELEDGIDRIDKLNESNGDLYRKYNKLKKENHTLINENRLLKDLVIENAKEQYQDSLIRGDDLSTAFDYPKIGKSFYVQIFLGIFVIILSLGFHILYLSVTSCLTYNEGNPFCWIANWLGIYIHASFYIDVILYSLIAIQVSLIILLVRNKLHELK